MIHRISTLARRCAVARAILATFAVATGFGAIGYKMGHDIGRIEGRTAAYRETDRVLRDLEHALAPLAQVSRQAENGDAP